MKKLLLVFGIIFSLLAITAIESQGSTNDKSFQRIENVVFEEYDFIQNGIKLEYEVGTSVEDEKTRIANILRSEKNLTVNDNGTSISANNDALSYTVTLYNEESTKVEIVIINNDNSIKYKELKLMVNNLKSNNSTNERYFLFIKGKLREENQSISPELFKEIDTKSLKKIDISNGNIQKGTLKDGNKVNIGQINYNTGTYLIIGTPVIFVTY